MNYYLDLELITVVEDYYSMKMVVVLIAIVIDDISKLYLFDYLKNVVVLVDRIHHSLIVDHLKIK